ncbi:heavy-metal-associated domain-containing protein [Edaphobacter dinghuensis]|uniref:HMA domain-containing protein n=1 Tax=Edaphobacter dinghuensis TaxID=1560005 RepID=A0A917HEC4_9BACT|nr:heavy metal-associated domain-containing protein [Edaphobacter dinghuensis]GGG75753.1 hypothetical protein GCM10011585_18250 [Edaphobacter dinghuensis]
MKESMRLSIDGMHCEACVRRVTDVLKKVNGLHLNSVEVGSAHMTFDPEETAAESIVAAINSIGFHGHFDQ